MKSVAPLSCPPSLQSTLLHIMMPELSGNIYHNGQDEMEKGNGHKSDLWNRSWHAEEEEEGKNGQMKNRKVHSWWAWKWKGWDQTEKLCMLKPFHWRTTRVEHMITHYPRICWKNPKKYTLWRRTTRPNECANAGSIFPSGCQLSNVPPTALCAISLRTPS